MLLADFHDADEAARWSPTDDVVMGGQSSSAMLAGDGVRIFAGELGPFRLELSSIAATSSRK